MIYQRLAWGGKICQVCELLQKPKMSLADTQAILEVLQQWKRNLTGFLNANSMHPAGSSHQAMAA
jgi:hypothetical protein